MARGAGGIGKTGLFHGRISAPNGGLWQRAAGGIVRE
jgi:hypothetical protein